MQKNKYLEYAFKKYNEGKISAEAYDAILENIDVFCDEDEEKNDADDETSHRWDEAWEKEVERRLED